MKARFLIVLAAMVLLAANAAAYCGGYYCEEYSTPYSYYSYEQWDGYTNWNYYAPNGRYYSYYGPSYYGYAYPYAYSHNYNYYSYYPSSVYYHAPYYDYYDYGRYYYQPGFTVSFGW